MEQQPQVTYPIEQQPQVTHPMGMLLQGRYLVEGLLGRGGFGSVYLVRDQFRGDRRIALKELTDRSPIEKQRLTAECAILERLDHPSLPQVEGIYEQNHAMYMLMEYIAGPNLEILRKQQPGERFSYDQVVTLIGPIIEAVTYLHEQSPPLIHRDIKPANIIVPESGERTVLVDFGVAKEYRLDATTTAVRHCSPGYSSPEQYSSMGTDMRADVYGLAATCYALLGGTPPSDALDRMTKIANQGNDSLVPLAELAPDTPESAVQAISGAMSINFQRRFRTPAAFWLAFIGATPIDLPTQPVLAMGAASATKITTPLSTEERSPWQRSRRGKARLAGVLLLLLLLAAAAFSLGAYAVNRQASPSRFATTPVAARVTATRSTTSNAPKLASSYSGTFTNILSNTRTNITLKNIQQTNQTFKGVLIEASSSTQFLFAGVIDNAKHLLLNVPAQGSQPPLYFQGWINAEGDLVGNYCSIDASGQCASNSVYGLWTVSPNPNS